jgi:hypothetical protein
VCAVACKYLQVAGSVFHFLMRRVASVKVATPELTVDEERLSRLWCVPRTVLAQQFGKFLADDSGMDVTTVVPYGGDTVVTLAARSGCSHLLLTAMTRVVATGRVTMTQVANGEVGGIRPGKPPLFDSTTVAVVELLLAHGADVNRTRGQFRPTDFAIFDGNYAVTKALMCAGGDTKLFDYNVPLGNGLEDLLRDTARERAVRWSPLRQAWVAAVATAQFAPAHPQPPKRRRVFGPK